MSYLYFSVFYKIRVIVRIYISNNRLKQRKISPGYVDLITVHLDPELFNKCLRYTLENQLEKSPKHQTSKKKTSIFG